MDQDKVPHVVFLPLPLSGHVKPMLTLAELLCDASFLITFVNSDYNHDRLERVMDIPAFYNRSPGFRFVTISDGLPLDHNTKGLVMDQDKVPHVVFLPLPLSGNVKPMLALAELLCDASFLITFVNSDYNHDRLERVMDIPAFYNRSPGFRFVSISDGLPLDQPRIGPIIFQLFFNTRTVSKPLLRELLISLGQSTERSPPTCIMYSRWTDVFRY
ncbi:7-deoxyloganetic acid glucosyltransferase [Quercus suber]|uniref:7-deoxyloganetic acid glucosyltransferase n=1 Tax=Quercus suber TaxID=58331 RepID=A0AAW0L7R8_QUESU